MKLLVIEDERSLSDSIVSYLGSQGYVCSRAFTYGEAMDKVTSYDYDCILLDLMLPGGDGLDILREIRKRNNPAGVIIISAKGSMDDKITGLHDGADDYLAKPFHLPELSMRIYAVIRRREFSVNNVVDSNDIHVDLLCRKVTVGGRVLDLTPMEYELLLFFVANRNKVISKGSIAEHLSGDMADMMDNYDFIYTHIKNLKSKIHEAGGKDSIRNIYGTGYKWDEKDE